MKKIIVFGFLLCASLSNTFAQGFEGILKWKMDLNVEGMLKSPEVKKVLQQMGGEQAATPEMIQMMKMMMPTGFDIKIKDGNTLLAVKGGMAASMGEILYRKDKKQSYNLDRAKATYSLMKNEKNAANSDKVKVTKTNATAVVAGYKCVQYKVETSVDNQPYTQFIWTTKEIKGIEKDLLKQLSAGQNNGAIFYEGMEGVPMKVAVGEMGLTIEVAEVIKSKLDANEFVIPSHFKEEN